MAAFWWRYEGGASSAPTAPQAVVHAGRSSFVAPASPRLRSLWLRRTERVRTGPTVTILDVLRMLAPSEQERIFGRLVWDRRDSEASKHTARQAHLSGA